MVFWRRHDTIRTLKRGPHYLVRLRVLLRWVRRWYPFWMSIWFLVKCFQSNQHFLLRLKRVPSEWSSVAVIAAVLTIMMASVSIESTTVSKYGSCCQNYGGEQE